MKFKLGDKVKVVNINKEPKTEFQFVEGLEGTVTNYSLNHQGFNYNYAVVFRINGVSYESIFNEKELEYVNF